MMSRKTPALLALALAMAAGLSGCKAEKPGPAGDGIARTANAAAASAYMLGSLAFQPCSLRSIMSRDSLPRTLEALRERAGAQ